MSDMGNFYENIKMAKTYERATLAEKNRNWGWLMAIAVIIIGICTIASSNTNGWLVVGLITGILVLLALVIWLFVTLPGLAIALLIIGVLTAIAGPIGTCIGISTVIIAYCILVK